MNYLNNSIKLKEDQKDLNEDYESDEEKKEISNKKTNIFQLNTIKTHINIISHPQKTINSMEIRDWVDHMISEEIDIRVMKLINELNYVQTIKKITQPRKAINF